MPRPRDVIRKVKFGVWITEDLRARLDLRLYSPVEGRVPFKAYSDFVERAVTTELNRLETVNVSS